LEEFRGKYSNAIPTGRAFHQLSCTSTHIISSFGISKPSFQLLNSNSAADSTNPVVFVGSPISDNQVFAMDVASQFWSSSFPGLVLNDFSGDELPNLMLPSPPGEEDRFRGNPSAIARSSVVIAIVVVLLGILFTIALGYIVYLKCKKVRKMKQINVAPGKPRAKVHSLIKENPKTLYRRRSVAQEIIPPTFAESDVTMPNLRLTPLSYPALSFKLDDSGTIESVLTLPSPSTYSERTRQLSLQVCRALPNPPSVPDCLFTPSSLLDLYTTGSSTVTSESIICTTSSISPIALSGRLTPEEFMPPYWNDNGTRRRSNATVHSVN
jgi:hypothetical protein